MTQCLHCRNPGIHLFVIRQNGMASYHGIVSVYATCIFSFSDCLLGVVDCIGPLLEAYLEACTHLLVCFQTSASDESVAHNEQYMLASLKVETLQASVTQQMSGYLEANASLADIILDDCRQERKGGITRLVLQG